MTIQNYIKAVESYEEDLATSLLQETGSLEGLADIKICLVCSLGQNGTSPESKVYKDALELHVKTLSSVQYDLMASVIGLMKIDGHYPSELWG